MSARQVIVTHENDAKTVGISFRYVDEERKIDRIFNFQRSTEEEMRTLLGRITCNIEKITNKKRKKKKDDEPPTATDGVEVKMVKLSDGNDVPEDMSCYQSFVTQANNHTLIVGDIKYGIDLNPPVVKTVELPKNIMSGYYLYPVKLEVMFGVEEQSLFQWFKSDGKFENDNEAQKNLSSITWLECGTGRIYHTAVEDIGRLIKVIVTPCDGERRGEVAEVMASVLVSAGPGECPFHRRQQLFTSHLAGENCLRVVSYNILADLYADSDHARTNLFPTCPAYAIAIDYRKQLLIAEITGYKGDLVCLQEVDEKVFLRDLEPALAETGLDGHYTPKGGSVNEGIALFYRRDKLRLLEKNRLILIEELQKNTLFSEAWERVQACPAAVERINRGTVLQISVLECVGEVAGSSAGRILVVGGTHLYFHPDADHVRLLQAGLCITLLRQVMQLYQVKYPEKEVCLVFCGDFNSTPEFAVYRLMTQQWVGEDDIDWSSADGEHIEGLSFNHDLELDSACGLPPYTNFTPFFHGCLDYIYYQTDKFDVKKVVPLPSHEEVTEHTALPSITMPSDHLPLIADLQFKSK
ncbi:hypothetical protein Pcinc_032865 [Petrolisthes cinctipes]|uniref:2',5'-phosphodiesterase 12 n=1 Tax=Petrolisthes cinctipes TaxID=88211 RepID=A0AAE1ETE6_PETCI|nr:hypothetical protein Pcinc_032865 [Petrolisthes cinctipes]